MAAKGHFVTVDRPQPPSNPGRQRRGPRSCTHRGTCPPSGRPGSSGHRPGETSPKYLTVLTVRVVWVNKEKRD